MSETTSCGGEGNDYINGTKKAYKGWVDVEDALGQEPDYYEWIADNSNYQGINIPIKSFEEFKVMYGDGHKSGPSTGVWDETTNANRPLPAKEVYGGWIENDELGLHYSDGWLQDGKYPWFINWSEDYQC